MKTCIKFFSVLVFAIGLNACTHGPSDSSSQSTCSNATIGASASLITTTNTNQIPVYIGDSSTTGQIFYLNQPLVSVTICSPNHTSSSQCQTISNILLDTGSFGLRVFGSAISSNVGLQSETVSIQGQTFNVAQCATFGIGADWGSVRRADVQLGNQTASNIPIQVIDSTFGTMPQGCKDLSPDTDPCSAGYNGILGVGMFNQDCGADCNSSNQGTNPLMYLACDSSQCFNLYQGACSGGTCAVRIPVASQVTNPVGQFATGFNNGLSMTLPAVSASGARGVSGTITFGIGSTAGNAPANSVVVYGADPNGMSDGNVLDFLTQFNSGGNTVYGASNSLSFIDSGSNGLFFPAMTGLPVCSPQNSFFCPTSTQNLQATVEGYSGTPSLLINFSVANWTSIQASGNSALNNLGGAQSHVFDWGLPFFLGRTIYVGIDGASATYHSGSATGPYWAF